MAADLHIHVLEAPCTEDDLAIFFQSTMGSKWFSWHQHLAWDDPKREQAWERVSNTPQLWIGEVSWLKAGLLEDTESFVPDPVMKVSELFVNEMRMCTEELIAQLSAAVETPVQAKASHYTTIGEVDKVREFLTPYIGKMLFTVSW